MSGANGGITGEVAVQSLTRPSSTLDRAASGSRSILLLQFRGTL